MASTYSKTVILILITISLSFSCNYKNSNKRDEQDLIVEVKQSFDTLGLNKNPAIPLDEIDIESKSDSTFDYRLKAFDNIYFGSHDNKFKDKVKLLNFTFTTFPQEHYYYGLFELRLSSELDFKDRTELLLEEISILLDQKYGEGVKVEKLIKEGPSPLFVLRASSLLGEKYDEENIPKDEGNNFVLKNWENSEVEIEIGYVISYNMSEDKMVSNGYNFEKVYKPYIQFSNKYLKSLISNLIKTESESNRKKRIKENESKF
jgi:hypothetical protein